LVFDDVTVEVEHRLGIVLGRGGESGVDTLDHGNLVVMGMRGEDVKVGHD
jgi:alkylation response protein AidB-like acyl-CoA dehydrogenase